MVFKNGDLNIDNNEKANYPPSYEKEIEPPPGKYSQDIVITEN